jgi:squalene-hopene/tetraprenyl-beta-curcumene cyclase
MARARREIRARGGAAGANIFTKLLLALFGFIPWRAVPTMPVEIMLFPKWFPFHLDKISYWSRTVIVPLLVLMALRPRARNPKNIRIDELFIDPPQTLDQSGAAAERAALFWFFRAADNPLRWGGRCFRAKHQLAIESAVAWVGERLNGDNGPARSIRRWLTA